MNRPGKWLNMILAALLFSATSFAGEEKKEEDVALDNDKSKVSYVIGLNMAGTMRQQGLSAEDLDLPAMMRGISDSLELKDPAISNEEVQRVMQSFMQQMQARMQQKADVGKEEADKILAENKAREGVKTTESGLQYKILRAGEGESPEKTDIVTVHYKGMLPDGTVFDSSYDRNEPAQLRLDRVIPGWTEAVPMMKVGGKWKLWLPPELAYGMRGSPPKIGPNQVLVFEIELIDIPEMPQMGDGQGE